MSSGSSNTTIQGADGNSQNKTDDRDHSKGEKEVEKTITLEGNVIHEPLVLNEDPQVSKDALEGGLKDHPLIESAVGLLTESVERELTGNKETDIALKIKIGWILFKSMPTVFRDVVHQEADAMIKARQAYQHSEELGKEVPLQLEKGDIGAKSDEYTRKALEDIVYQDFSDSAAVIEKLARRSSILIGALDEMAKIHPIIQTAVSLFKAGIKLQLTRRENDKKAVTLNIIMCDMMEALLILKEVADPKAQGIDGVTIEDRLKPRMGKIRNLIARCVKVCDSYQNQYTVVKFFTSLKWKAEFANVAQQFLQLKKCLQLDFQFHTSVTITKLSESDISRLTVELMEMVFKGMWPPEERKVVDLISEYPAGEEAARKDDTLVEKILAMQKSKDGKGQPRRYGGAAKPDKMTTISELRQEASRNVDQVLEDNKNFDKRLEVVRMQVDEAKVTIRRETDRAIDTPVSGVEGIIDSDIYQVWKEKGWGDSVKANVLVMAIYDHFSKPEGSPEDRWALKHIPVLGVQLLVEELDDDVSLPVTVSKVNAFSAARPHTWSLPEWISYWTRGFEMTMQWYLHRIRKVIAEIRRSSNIALSSNLKQLVEDVLPGLGDIKEWEDFDWEDDYVFYKFKDYVAENEGRMERALRVVDYRLDTTSTLTIVAGEGRLEKYVLPLILLLMRKALWVVKQPGRNTLHELKVISGSVSTLADAVYDRVLELQGVYESQNQNEKDQLSKFFFELVRSVQTFGWRPGLGLY